RQRMRHCSDDGNRRTRHAFRFLRTLRILRPAANTHLALVGAGFSRRAPTKVGAYMSIPDKEQDEYRCVAVPASIHARHGDHRWILIRGHQRGAEEHIGIESDGTWRDRELD